MFPQGPSGLTLFPTAAPAGSTAAPGLTLDMPQVDVEQWSDVFQCSPLSPGSQFMYEESDEALLVRSLCGGSTGLMTEQCGMLDSSQAAMFDVASRADGSGSSCGSGSPHVFSPSFEKMKFEECFTDATAATLTEAQCGGLSGAVKIEKDLNKWSDGLSSVSTSTRCLDVSSRLAECGTAVEDAGPTLAQLNSQDLSVLDGLEHLDSVLLGDLDLTSFDSSLLANLLSSSVTTISSTVNNNNNNNNIYSNVASSPSATLSSPQQTSTPQSFGGGACGGGVWQIRKDLLDEDQQMIVLQEDCGLQEMLSNPLLAAGQDLLTLVGSAGPQQLQQINTAAVAYSDTKQLQRATSLVIGSSTFSSPLEMLPAVMRSNSSVTAADSWMGLTDQMLITSKLESPSAAITAAADIATIAAEEMVIESSPILSHARGTAAVVSTSAVAAAAGVSRVAAASAVRGKKVEQKLKQQQLVVKQLPQQQKQQRKRTRSAGDDYYNDDDDDDDSDIDSEYDSDTETGRSGGEDGTGFLREFVGGGSGGKIEKRYFWQYNTQAKGPKGKRLCKTVESVDPHVLNDFEDPVFDPEQNQTKYKHNGKARRGDGNDITPNPYKLFTVGNELKKLNKLINSISPPGELPSPVRLRSLKEKNKFASRACRLKKKAQHEANKLKLFGLEQEHKQLMRVLTGIRQLIVDRMDSKQSSAALNTDNRMTNKLETLMKSHLTMMIAGHTADYVNTILQRVSEGDKSGGISLDD